jgi:hypothetical protein
MLAVRFCVSESKNMKVWALLSYSVDKMQRALYLLSKCRGFDDCAECRQQDLPE